MKNHPVNLLKENSNLFHRNITYGEFTDSTGSGTFFLFLASSGALSETLILFPAADLNPVNFSIGATALFIFPSTVCFTLFLFVC